MRILLKLYAILKKSSAAIYPTFKLQPMEVFKDKSSERPYVIISPIGKYSPHNIFLEDLLEQKPLLEKLNFDSLCYVFHAYGILRASEHNDFYYLDEVMPFNHMIKVKNIKTLDQEEWTKDMFYINYSLLDKKSLLTATEFFTSISDITISNNSYTGLNQIQEGDVELKLIK